MDLNKLSVPRMGRPHEKQGGKEELLECIRFFISRKIGVPQLIKVLSVSQTMAYRWWKTHNITQAKLEKLQEVVQMIKLWELENGKEYNS